MYGAVLFLPDGCGVSLAPPPLPVLINGSSESLTLALSLHNVVGVAWGVVGVARGVAWVWWVEREEDETEITGTANIELEEDILERERERIRT